MKILVTAFDPFGGETVNPAQQAVERLENRIGEHEVCKLIIPTVFGKAADLVIEKMEKLRPDAVVCVGQAGGRKAVTPERVAINVMDAGIADNEGNRPVDEPVVPGGPAAYFSTLPVKKMVNAIKEAGLPAEISNSAGTFVCNSLLYAVLHHAETKMPGIRAVFVHVPYIPEQVEGKKQAFAMPLDDIVRALTAAVACLETV